ncbi:MAG: hydrogenase maturation nickel metallochaperone HypA [Chloroflexi bacterium]|nr:hydrogenase maturation nickel metallochaperone HypA [Chloroflexota bacterium]
MAEEKPGAKVRCKGCAARFFVEQDQKQGTCPKCGQGWRIRWFDSSSAMITAPVSWRDYQIKARRITNE